MMIRDGAIAALAALLLLVAAQVAGLLGYVPAMRWCWGLAVVAGALAVWLDRRDPF